MYYDSNNYRNECNCNRRKQCSDPPLVFNIEEATLKNDNYRTTVWTGNYLQLTLMSIKPRCDIGIEMHEDVDQFIRIEQGNALVQMGDCRGNLTFRRKVCDGWAILIPAGTWHNITNISNSRLKVYSLYAPPEHERGTVHRTKADAMADEHHG